jgi:hypothetical protein
MSQENRMSLLEIEQEVESQAREWHRQRLQGRLQAVADQHGAVCPLTGEALQEARYQTVSLITVQARSACAPITDAIPGPASGSVRSGYSGTSSHDSN